MEKTYRIFISSCKRLLESERQMLSNVILMNGHLPVQMEYTFLGANTEYSIEVDMKKIQNADCMIFILSYLYGEIIEKKIGDKNICPLKCNQDKNCDSCYDPNGCRLSFTQFEYGYARLLKKPIVVIYNRNYANDEEFAKANIEYQKHPDVEDCKSAYYEFKNKNCTFVSDVTQKHAFPYTNHDDFYNACSLAVKSAEDLIKIRESSGVNDLGLVPFTYLFESEERVNKIEILLKQIQESGIENIYDSQSAALEALALESDIYLGVDGKLQDIRVLAIRGASFTGGMGHEWTRFVLDEEFKEGEVINVEFVLSNYKNDALIEERYTAFSPKNASAKTLKAYKAGYIKDMERAQVKINEYRKKHPCKLFLHNESKLPFRMVFIGKYLYLSSFLNSVKAVESPVMKIPSTSTLYRVCEEYYKWVRDNAEEQT